MLVCLIALLIAGPQTSDAPVSVTVVPLVSHEPGTFEVAVHVAEDARNRLLTLVIDGPEYLARSTRSLDGSEAPLLHDFVFRNVPAGDYTIEAVVSRDDGTDETAEQAVKVIGFGG